MKKRVEQYDLEDNYITTFNSYQEAATKLNCDESTIRKSAKFGKTVLGKYWFIDEDKSDKEIQINSKYELMPPVKFDNSPIEIKTGPKILFIDVETSLLLAQVFQKQVWKARIGHSQIISDYYILTWSAKWLGEEEIISNKLTEDEVFDEDDSRIVWSLWELLDEADIIIGHNSDSFDIPNIYTRLVYHGYPPPSPFKQIDTLKIAQKTFGFTHNSLDALANFFGIEGKLPTTLELWKRCIRGEEDALAEMEAYNKQDVVVLEQIYYRLRPYAKGLPNFNLFVDSSTLTCPTCGESTILMAKDKYFYTQSMRYNVLRCTSCGATFRSKQGVPFINKKVISPIPR